MVTIYGIPNCDTIKKTLVWFNSRKIDFVFHDYKQEGITAAKLKEWCKQVGWEIVLNRKSTTWREAGADLQASVNDEKKAIAFLKDHTSAIKRPVIEKDGKVIAVGFNAELLTKVLG